MRVLFVGDIVGVLGRKATARFLEEERPHYRWDLAVANAENAAGGMGLTPEIAHRLTEMGLGALTLGNHVWRKKELVEGIDDLPSVIRPANMPPGNPGRGARTFDLYGGEKLAVVNLMGRVFMEPIDCPFAAMDGLLKDEAFSGVPILVDFHAEATSEKIAFFWDFNGRVAAVCGSHTHVQTADDQVSPQGTAYITDVGMTGPLDSVIGIKPDAILRKFRLGMPARFEVQEEGDAVLSAVLIEIDAASRKAASIERIVKTYSW
jgi:metallophosphoesterase (TIGR00282 family)